MADVFRKNNYEIKPVLKFLLTSDEFFGAQYRGAKIKNPMETTIGTLKAFDLTPAQMTPTSDWAYIYNQTQAMQQQLFLPPDVQGWVGQRDWISSTTFVLRGSTSDYIVNTMGNTRATQFKLINNPVNYARTYKTSEDAAKLVDDMVTVFLQFPISAAKKQSLLNILLANGATIVTNWSTSSPGADNYIKNLLKAIMRLPEFQLA
jgi:uncharacterized protein (DUF1800 family)